jgi:DNA-binding HxlR family transcriptional regulator
LDKEAQMARPNLKLVDVDYAAEGEANCKALGQIFERIGDKWTIMIVGALSRGPLRFNALQRSIPGLSHKMLTVTLRGLERDGLVTRTPYATIPPRVDYELTPQGRSLHEPLLTLASWARSRQRHIEKSRKAFDHRDID